MVSPAVKNNISKLKRPGPQLHVDILVHSILISKYCNACELAVISFSAMKLKENGSLMVYFQCEEYLFLATAYSFEGANDPFKNFMLV